MEESNNGNNGKVTVLLVAFGLLIGYWLGNEPEKEPYSVWMERGNINIQQEEGGVIFYFMHEEDGYYTYTGTSGRLK